MLIRYLSQIGKYFLMWKEIFNKPTKWSVMKGLIFKEIDDLIIGSLGIVAFISFFVGGVVARNHRCRIPRREPKDQEHDHRHREQHGDQRQQALHQKTRHE